MRNSQILLVLALSMFCACSVETDKTDKTPSLSDVQSTESQPSRGLPADYMPFTSGQRLEYVITNGTKEPLNAQVVVWLMGTGGIGQLVRGRFYRAIDKPAGQIFSLVLRVVGAAVKQGPFSWDGVKVDVVKDDLKIFDNVDELYWNRTGGGDFNVLEVRVYSPDSPGAPSGSWGSRLAESGSSSRIIFHDGKPGTVRSLGPSDSKDFKDRLSFLGFDQSGRLHFVRKVVAEHKKTADREDDMLNQDFQEDTWFERGRGMVRLEQRINGVVSMVWELQKNSSLVPGRF